MGRLKKYAKKPTVPRSKPISSKLSEKEYRDFVDYVKSLGLKVSEGIRLLILEEIYNGEQSNSKPMFTKTNQRYDKSSTKKISLDENELQKKTKVNPRKAAVYLKKFKIDGKLPCPICKTWTSAAHFKQRHAEKHEGKGVDSAIFLAKHEDIALQMVDQLIDQQKK